MSRRDLVRDAVRGVRLFRLRSLLTAASFAAGTAAVVSLFAITDGARAAILERIRALGADLLAVRPVGEPSPGMPPALTVGDAAVLARALPFVTDVAPVRLAASSTLLPDQRVSVRVVGTTPGYFELLRLPFRRGRPGATGAWSGPQCVLGAGAARALFPHGNAYGSLVKVGESWYRVVGVLAADATIGGVAGAGGEGAGREVYLPITNTLRETVATRDEVGEIWLRIDDAVGPERAAPVVERVLLRRHEGRRGFEVATPERLLRRQREARGLFDLLLGLVAAAAFALGGVGMMSVSWQAVAERTGEIAVRRAVGARRVEILAQFLLEGGLLAAAGALAGIVLGAAVSAAAAGAVGWPWLLSPARLLLAAGVAIGVALLSTVHPALRAASLDPVAALRFER